MARVKTETISEIKVLTEAFDRDKRKMKDSYEALINELSAEIKQIYEKMDNEIELKDKKLKELYSIIQEKDKILEENRHNFMVKLDTKTHDVETLTETNKYRNIFLDTYCKIFKQ